MKSASKLLENLPSPLRNQIGTGEESEDDPSILDVADDQVIWSITYFFVFGLRGYLEAMEAALTNNPLT